LDERLRENVLFVVKFFAIFGVLHLLLYIAPLGFLKNGIAALEAGALGLRYENSRIFFDSGSFEINESCTGLVSGIILFAVVFSLRRPEIGKKTILFLVGFAVLLAANLLRIYAVLAVALQFGAEFAETLHTVTWLSTAALILLLWYYLTKKVAKIRNFGELLQNASK